MGRYVHKMGLMSNGLGSNVVLLRCGEFVTS